MKRLLEINFFRKHGRKALIIYLCWCVLKGFVFFYAGFKWLG